MTDTPSLTVTDPVTLTTELIDIASESHHEHTIATAVEHSLRSTGTYEVTRIGNTIAARTNYGKPQRVILAGHLDTVPAAGNIPHRKSQSEAGQLIYGLGAVDMKSGDAIFLHLAHCLANPSFDITYIFYDCEEVSSAYNGLGKLYAERPDLLTADLAILGEPTNGIIEAGCQGSLQGSIIARGKRAHSARSWLGTNAIELLAEPLKQLQNFTGVEVPIDGCVYHEGLNAVKINGGVATNVIPDEATLAFNYRFAPNKSADQAAEFIKEYFAPSLTEGLELHINDIAAGARPGLNHPLARTLVAAASGPAVAKYGWTDVSRFSALGIPALNLGPGDPSLAHKPEEHVPISHITTVTELLTRFLTNN